MPIDAMGFDTGTNGVVGAAAGYQSAIQTLASIGLQQAQTREANANVGLIGAHQVDTLSMANLHSIQALKEAMELKTQQQMGEAFAQQFQQKQQQEQQIKEQQAQGFAQQGQSAQDITNPYLQAAATVAGKAPLAAMKLYEQGLKLQQEKSLAYKEVQQGKLAEIEEHQHVVSLYGGLLAGARATYGNTPQAIAMADAAFSQQTGHQSPMAMALAGRNVPPEHIPHLIDSFVQGSMTAKEQSAEARETLVAQSNVTLHNIEAQKANTQLGVAKEALAEVQEKKAIAKKMGMSTAEMDVEGKRALLEKNKALAKLDQAQTAAKEAALRGKVPEYPNEKPDTPEKVVDGRWYKVRDSAGNLVSAQASVKQTNWGLGTPEVSFINPKPIGDKK